jgi:hypothetical protein
MKVTSSDIARFWSKVKVAAPSECWEWQGYRTPKGYGVIRLSGKNVYAHRLSYTIAKGEIADGYVCHACDNPCCVNPSHLSVGTPLDNATDRDTRNRQVVLRGEASSAAKLNEVAVRDIREQMTSGTRGTQSALARKYGVNKQTIAFIISGRNWRSVK